MALKYLLLESGDRIQLEDASGALLLETPPRLATWYRGAPDAERAANVQDELRLSNLQGAMRPANVQRVTSEWRH